MKVCLKLPNLLKQSRSGKANKIACLEEIGYLNGWLSDEELKAAAAALSKNSYGAYLSSILKDRNQK